MQAKGKGRFQAASRAGKNGQGSSPGVGGPASRAVRPCCSLDFRFQPPTL